MSYSIRSSNLHLSYMYIFTAILNVHTGSFHLHHFYGLVPFNFIFLQFWCTQTQALLSSCLVQLNLNIALVSLNFSSSTCSVTNISLVSVLVQNKRFSFRPLLMVWSYVITTKILKLKLTRQIVGGFCIITSPTISSSRYY